MQSLIVGIKQRNDETIFDICEFQSCFYGTFHTTTDLWNCHQLRVKMKFDEFYAEAEHLSLHIE